jgi:hypothetical protein
VQEDTKSVPPAEEEIRTADAPTVQAEGAVSQIDPLDRTIAWLVQDRDASVRLINCVIANEAISQMSLRHFLSDLPTTRDLLLKSRNLGRKTADELCVLASTVAAERVKIVTTPEESPEADEFLAMQLLFRLLSNIPFPDALLRIDVSMRLRNCLKAVKLAKSSQSGGNAFPESLGGVLANWTEVCGKLLKQPNFGKTSLVEIARLIEKIINKRLEQYCVALGVVSGFTLKGVAEYKLSPPVIEALLRSRAELVEEIYSDELTDVVADLLALDSCKGLSPLDHVTKVVSNLPEKEHDVIIRRYGLDGRSPETLQQVAAQFHVSRERVRQVEKKALNRLSLGSNRLAFDRLLEAEREGIWNLLSKGSDLLLPVDLDGIGSAIKPECLLAIEVSYGRLVDWVASVGRPFSGGFLRGQADPDEIRRSAVQVADWAARAPGPVPMEAIMHAGDVSRESLDMAIRLRSDLRIFEEYLVVGHLGSQVRRTCRLHVLALSFGNSTPFDIATLCREYALLHPSDNVSQRMIYLQLERAPHLFLRLFDHIWIAIDSGRPQLGERTLEKVPFEQGVFDSEPAFEPESIGAWLYSALEGGGPTRSVDLDAQAKIEMPKAIASTSVGAVLQSNPEFVRVAPGIYGLQKHLAKICDPVDGIAPALLSVEQCRYYAASRFAGDPVNLYPAWNFHLEEALCRWAYANAPDDTYRSMLAVSTPSEWPLQQAEELSGKNASVSMVISVFLDWLFARHFVCLPPSTLLPRPSTSV